MLHHHVHLSYDKKRSTRFFSKILQKRLCSDTPQQVDINSTSVTALAFTKNYNLLSGDNKGLINAWRRNSATESFKKLASLQLPNSPTINRLFNFVLLFIHISDFV